MATKRPLVLDDGKVSRIQTGDTLPLDIFPPSITASQKYYVAPLEIYTISSGISSVISGPFENEGIVILNGRLEVL